MQAAPRSLPSVAPLRGVFPLDHERACKPRADAFIECIRASAGAAHAECRGLSRAYLECRMAAGLMAKESIADLGLGDAPPAAAPAAPAAPAPPAAPDAPPAQIVAGLSAAKRRPGFLFGIGGAGTGERGGGH